jgi:NRPS condensation-like uncharacterized protein
LSILTRTRGEGEKDLELPHRIASSSTDRIMSMSLENNASDGQGRVLIFFDGRLNETLLERAVKMTLEAEPILTYRFVAHPWRPYWQRVEEKDRASCFKIMECSPSSPELSDFLTEPVSPSHSPQVRVGLFRSDKDILCIRMNHMIMDGGGAIAYLALLSSSYRDLEKDPAHRPTANIDRARSPRQVLRRGGLLTAIKGLPGLQVPGPPWGIPKNSDDRSGRAIMIRKIDPDRSGIIRSYAREKGVSVNDVLLTAFYRSLFIIVDSPRNLPLRIEVPINLRRYLPPGRSAVIGNLSAVYYPTIDRRDNERFEDTLQRVHRAVEVKKKRQEELAEMLFIELVLLPGMFLIKGLAKFVEFEIAHPVLSNLGIIDPEAVNFGMVPVDDVHFLGPVHFPPNVGMGVNTFQQKMTLSLTYCDTAIAPNTMDHLFELFLDELPGGHVPPSAMVGR